MWHLDSRMNSLTGLYASLIEVKQPRACFLQHHSIRQVVYSLLGLHTSFEREEAVMYCIPLYLKGFINWI